MKDYIENDKLNFKDFLIFIIIYFITIGSKEIFRFFETLDSITSGTVILSIVCIVLILNHPKKYSRFFLLGIFFYIFLFIMSFKNSESDYGIQKAFLGILVPLTIFTFICKKKWNEYQLLKYFIYTILILGFIAIVYKLFFGFFTRAVSFGLLGSIPFGWVNGMALLAVSLKKDKKLNDFILMFFFFSMVIWKGSKGPLLSFLIVAFFNFKKILGNKFSTKLIVLLLVFLTFFVLQSFGDDIRAIKTINKFIEDPEGYSEGAGQGSIGARSNYLEYSLDLFDSNPILGVGFGGWNNSFYVEHRYPHNIYAELLSEVGLIGFLLFVLLLFNLKYKSVFGYMGVFGLICLSFSGDFSYLRYSFLLLLISTFLVKENKTLEQLN